jgi:hypothetical protein
LFNNKQKAIDHSIWLNFKYRISRIRFGVLHRPDNNWAVCEEATAQEMEIEFLDILPKDYSEMTYDDIRHIRMDSDSLPSWDKIIGLFSIANGEILRFILQAKIPLERLIRHELAGRGYDENHRWIGFGKASDIWLK